ncbi:hypothetical protein JHK85_001090 [Glycine max]|nr:hypothetical protein JHK85_001090 [Glycine max]
MESGKLSRGQLHGQTSEDKLSKGDSDDEMLSSVLKRTRRPSLKSKQVELENIQIHERIMGDDSFNGGIIEVSEGKMLKKMKKQPLLFVELLFWKTRRECHYINAEYLLSELGHLKKESANWNNTQGDEEIGSSPAKEALSKFPYNIKTSFDFQNMGYEKGETGKKTLFSGPALLMRQFIVSQYLGNDRRIKLSLRVRCRVVTNVTEPTWQP